MLRSIRDNIRGRAAKFVLAIMIIPFVFFGVDALVDGGGVGNVLEVNGEEVSREALFVELQIVQNEMLAQMGDNVDYSQLTEEKLTPIALDRLTRQTLVNQTVESMKMNVPDALVETVIASSPAFQADGQFSNELLNQWLTQQRMTFSRLKSRVANDLKERQIAAGVTLSSFAVPQDTDFFLEVLNETREINWVKLPQADIAPGISVSDDELVAYYDANTDDFVSELTVVVDYIDLRLEDLFEPVSDEDVEAEYRSQSAQFEADESRRVAHILLEINDAQTKEQAEETLATVAARAAAGESFADLAREFSQDPGSAEAGGDLGYAQQDGTFPSAFEDAIFALAVNEVSAPVETDAGLHLVTVTEIDVAKMESLEELRPIIAEQLQIRDAQARYVKLLEDAADIAFNSADLSEPAAALDLTVKSAGSIGRNGPVANDYNASNGVALSDEALFTDQRILNAVFSDEVFTDRQNSEPVELAPNRSVLLRVKESFEPRQLSFDEVKAQIEPIAVKDKAKTQLNDIGQTIIASVDGSEANTLAAAAERAGYQVANNVLMRNTVELDRELLAAIFEAPRTLVDDTAVQVLESEAGDLYLYQLVAVETSENADNPQIREMFSQQLRGNAGQQEVAAFLKSVEVNAEITRY